MKNKKLSSTHHVPLYTLLSHYTMVISVTQLIQILSISHQDSPAQCGNIGSFSELCSVMVTSFFLFYRSRLVHHIGPWPVWTRAAHDHNRGCQTDARGA